jgi:hypothetical protein
MTNGDVYAALDHHVSAFWPNNTQEAFTWDKGPISDRIPGFHVRRVTPNAATEPWVYVSIGASTVVNKYGNEYFILSPIESARHIETLAMVAHFQSFEAHTAGVGDTLNIGHPWLHDSPFDHLVVTMPYPYGPNLEIAPKSANDARFLWLVPISAAEAEFIRNSGFDRFEDLIEESEVDVIDPHRRDLVK